MGYFCGYPHFYPAKVILFCDIDKYFYDRLCFFRKLPTSFGSTIGDLWNIYGLSVAVLGRSFNHSQVDCGLRDNFATTVAHHKIGLSLTAKIHPVFIFLPIQEEK